MTNTSFQAAGFALAFALAAGGCPHSADFPAPTGAVSVDITADGSDTEPTTELTLKFDQPIAVLSKDDITLTDDGGTGIQKDELKAAGVYKLKVSGITKSGDVTVTVAKAGYAFKGSPKTVQVYASSSVAVSVDITANGS
ncbi:hypothetical protein, partial [Treponema endosymbiont of Eucomonympha sp.]|uniref:hypothetical protein n=1 Tax=Treponema endosymbiont of Eucomonympha sp. TaxID=1580831 RepID=UPI000AC7E3FA